MNKNLIFNISGSGIVLLLLLAYSPAFAQKSSLSDVVNTFRADQRALKGFYTFNESEEYYQRLIRFYQNWKNKLDTMGFDALNQQEKVDFILLKNLINKESYFLELSYQSFQEVASVNDFAKEIYPFIQERRRGKRPDARKIAQLLNQAVSTIDIQIKSLKQKPYQDWITADKASRLVLSFQQTLKEAYYFYYNYDPEFTWWVQKPYEALNKKLTEYAIFIKENYSKTSIKDDGSGIVGKPIGKKALLQSLTFEFIPYTPEELIQIAEKQFNWCKSEMIKASQELGYGDDWKAALEHVKDTYVPPGEQPQVIKDLYDQSIAFIEERDLITLPELAKETWGMIMMTPERQKVNPFFTGGWEISISYPTQEMSQTDKMMSMRGNNPNFSRATVHHELLPGHNLQYFMMDRHKSYRKAFDTPFWVEGWALCWEITLWNKGFPKTPEQKLGMLFWRIHRCARIIFSLKYHLGQMTPQQCINLLVNEVGHEYANAEAEVRRSFTTSYPPLYQAAYMLGGLQFYALRNEMMSRGWTEKQFHDRVMKENVIPIELMRSLFQDIPLKKNFQTQWKFSTEFK